MTPQDEVIGLILLFLTLPGLFQMAWNHTLPELLGLKRISYRQAFALIFMARVLIPIYH